MCESEPCGPGSSAHHDPLVEELRAQARRKDQFLAMLAHEMRNPLAPIANALHLISIRSDDPLVVHSASAIISRQVAQLTRLVEDLFDLARCTHGKIELRKESVNLADVAAAAVETARPLIVARKHRLTVRSTAVFVEGDTTRLTQALANLLINAAKFTHEGGHIRLAVEANTRWAAIRVRDTGVGISREMLPHVFDIHAQGGNRPEGSSDGLGLGLTLARQLVELHGGTLCARSEGDGLGSEFVMRLPVLRSSSVRTRARAERARNAPIRRPSDGDRSAAAALIESCGKPVA